jgi:hypothetical protein
VEQRLQQPPAGQVLQFLRSSISTASSSSASASGAAPSLQLLPPHHQVHLPTQIAAVLATDITTYTDSSSSSSSAAACCLASCLASMGAAALQQLEQRGAR